MDWRSQTSSQWFSSMRTLVFREITVLSHHADHSATECMWRNSDFDFILNSGLARQASLKKDAPLLGVELALHAQCNLTLSPALLLLVWDWTLFTMDYKVQTINSAETACFIFKTKTLCKCPSWSNLTSNLQSSPPATPAAATSTPPRSRPTSPRRAAAAAVSTPPPPRRGRPQTPHPSSSSSTWDSQVRLL